MKSLCMQNSENVRILRMFLYTKTPPCGGLTFHLVNHGGTKLFRAQKKAETQSLLSRRCVYLSDPETVCVLYCRPSVPTRSDWADLASPDQSYKTKTKQTFRALTGKTNITAPISKWNIVHSSPTKEQWQTRDPVINDDHTDNLIATQILVGRSRSH